MIFSNAVPIEAKTNLEGTIQIQYTLWPERDNPHGHYDNENHFVPLNECTRVLNKTITVQKYIEESKLELSKLSKEIILFQEYYDIINDLNSHKINKLYDWCIKNKEILLKNMEEITVKKAKEENENIDKNIYFECVLIFDECCCCCLFCLFRKIERERMLNYCECFF